MHPGRGIYFRNSAKRAMNFLFFGTVESIWEILFPHRIVTGFVLAKCARCDEVATKPNTIEYLE